MDLQPKKRKADDAHLDPASDVGMDLSPVIQMIFGPKFRNILVDKISKKAEEEILLPLTRAYAKHSCRISAEHIEANICCKYRAEGYLSPEEYLDAEYDGKSLEEVVDEEENSWRNITKISKENKKKLVDLTNELLDYHCDASNDNAPKLLRVRDEEWADAMRCVCKELNELAAALDPQAACLIHDSVLSGEKIITLRKKPKVDAETATQKSVVCALGFTLDLGSRGELIEKVSGEVTKQMYWRRQENGELKSSDKTKLLELTSTVVDFYCGNSNEEVSKDLPPLNGFWRKFVHEVCASLFKLASFVNPDAAPLEHVSSRRSDCPLHQDFLVLQKVTHNNG